MASKPRRNTRSSYLGALRRQRGRAEVEDDNTMSAVIARISQTPDGDLFLAWIHQQTLGRVLPDDASDGALRASEARKSFAATIFNLLDRGLSENATAKRNGN